MNKKVLLLLKIMLVCIIVIPSLYLFLTKQDTVGTYTIQKTKCIGCESCVEVCPVNAISMYAGKAVIDQEKCIQCGLCYNGIGEVYSGCPVNAINENIEDVEAQIEVEEKVLSQNVEVSAEPVVKDSIYVVIPAGCISCGLCVSNCPVNAIEMINGKAVIDQEKCIKCGICVDGNTEFAGCPVNTIIFKEKD